MNIRKIREDLGRAKASCMRRDLLRALYLTIAALRELGGQTAPSDLRGDIRTTVNALSSDPGLVDHLPPNVTYQPGNEKELLQIFARTYKKFKAHDEQEDYETTLQRKLNLDRWIKDGKKFLDEGRPSDADACFTEAMKYYKDEQAVFVMMAKAMMDAGEYVRAIGHARNGLKENPQDETLSRLIDECTRLRPQT